MSKVHDITIPVSSTVPVIQFGPGQLDNGDTEMFVPKWALSLIIGSGWDGDSA